MGFCAGKYFPSLLVGVVPVHGMSFYARADADSSCVFLQRLVLFFSFLYFFNVVII
jgi:hypothetical protein